MRRLTTLLSLFLAQFAWHPCAAAAPLPVQVTGSGMASKSTGSPYRSGGWAFWENGSASHPFSLDSDSSGELFVVAYGSPAGGVWPRMRVRIEGARGSVSRVVTVDSASPKTFRAGHLIGAGGTVTVGVEFLNDGAAAGQDRNLFVERLRIAPIDQQNVAIPGVALAERSNGEPWGTAWNLWTNGATAETVYLGSPKILASAFYARGWAAGNVWPDARLSITSGTRTLTERRTSIASQATITLPLAETIIDAPFKVSLEFLNDSTGPGGDRNVVTDNLYLSFRDGSPPNWRKAAPVLSRPVFVPPQSSARRALAGLQPGSREHAAAQFIADNSAADWFGEWVSDPEGRARTLTTGAASADSTPVLTVYAIPHRDCGQFSAGGLTPSAYSSWVRKIAAGIGPRRAVVVLEPDALGLIEQCGSVRGFDPEQRFALLEEAVRVLGSLPATLVYVDVGHWMKPAIVAPMVRRVNASGLLRGVALNVSNFQWTSSMASYCSSLGLGLPCLVDTSRNGKGPGSTWCNPWGRALGALSSFQPRGDGLDGVVWVKSPGQSDGTCGGGPAAGTYWPAMGRDLYENSGR